MTDVPFEPAGARATPESSDSIARFAADLRMLRIEAGNPTLAHLQHVTGISRTVLSDALGGRHLPSTRTVHGLVRACAGDPGEWVRRRDAIAGLHTGTPIDETVVTRTVSTRAPAEHRWVVMMAAVAAFVAGVMLTSGVAVGVLVTRDKTST